MKAEPLFAEFGDASKGIREGMPMGAVVTLTGMHCYLFTRPKSCSTKTKNRPPHVRFHGQIDILRASSHERVVRS